MSESRPHPHLRVAREGAAQTITLSNVARRNAQTPSMWLALAELAAALDPAVRVVVLNGDGSSFSSGLDRGMLTADGVEGEASLLEAAARGADHAARMIEPFQRGFAAWAEVDALVIASVQGHAIGAGFQLALAADLRIVADDVQLAMRETSLGLVPDLAGTRALVGIVGYARALEICMTGRSVGAAEAVASGLASMAVAAEDLTRATSELVVTLLAAPEAAVRELKPLLRLAMAGEREDQLRRERLAQGRLLHAMVRAKPASENGHRSSAGSQTLRSELTGTSVARLDAGRAGMAEYPAQAYTGSARPGHRRHDMRVPLTLIDFVERGALHGGRVAVVDEPEGPASLGEVTHADLVRRARGMACALDRMGVAHGARVAIVSPNSARFVIALFGVSAYGRVLVPINFRLTAAEVGYIVDHSGAEVLLIDPELGEALGGVEAPHRMLLDGIEDAELFAPTDAQPEPWEPDEDATASINYTSGTTARPKGVELTHRTLWLHAVSVGWHLGVAPGDVELQGQPLFHCNGWGLPYGLTAMGACQVMLRKVDGAEILRRVERHGVTLSCGAPAVLDAVLAANAARDGEAPGHGTLRWMTGGAPPSTTTITRVETELGWRLVHGYGLTESSPVLTMNCPFPDEAALPALERARRLARQGMAAVGVRLRVDAHGEVLARSNHVLASYWNDPEATEAAIGEGWLHTGDGGVIDEESHLTITDRKKDVIISGGENVSSIEVEDCLFSHPDVIEVAVIGVPHERWGETVKALVVVREGCAADEAVLIAFTRERMAHFKCPTSVELRDALPRTATGKIQKFLLRAPYWEGVPGPS